MPHPTAHLTNGLTFRELAYEDSNLPKLIEILTLNKVGKHGEFNVIKPVQNIGKLQRSLSSHLGLWW